jgi:hypothetical protein
MKILQAGGESRGIMICNMRMLRVPYFPPVLPHCYLRAKLPSFPAQLVPNYLPFTNKNPAAIAPPHYLAAHASATS